MYLRLYEYPLRHRYRFKAIGFRGVRPCFDKNRAETVSSLFKLENSLCRSRRTIRDYILCNRFVYFCTFTFDNGKIDRYNLAACKKSISQYFNDFRKRYAPGFLYLIVPECHKDGAWHFHGLISGIPASEFIIPEKIHVRDRKTQDLKEIPNTKGYVRWERYSKRFGFFDCSKIRHYEACATYVSKYITKSLASMQKSKRLFFASQGLCKPYLAADLDGIPFTYAPDYEDEWCQMAWLTARQTIGDILPDWYDEQCADLRDLDPTGNASREKLEALIFEPLTYEQMKLQYLEHVTQNNDGHRV